MRQQISVTKIEVSNSEDRFLSPIKLNIFFSVKEELQEELEWKIIYVGSAESGAFDQVLEQFIMNNLTVGELTFELNVNHPDPSKIPLSEMCGATVMMICAFYRNQEFFSYFVYNDVEVPSKLDQSKDCSEVSIKDKEEEEEEVEIDAQRMMRWILSDKPRIKHTEILWDGDFYSKPIKILKTK